jgi:zinc transporter ZupT
LEREPPLPLAAVVFVPSHVKYASKKTLAAGLGLSAGVMTYVSFVEIFPKSIRVFVDAGINHDTAYVYSTLCFFAGIFLMVVSALLGEFSRLASPRLVLSCLSISLCLNCILLFFSGHELCGPFSAFGVSPEWF